MKPNRRADILAAARKLIRTRGVSGVTTRQIAETAGCSEGALYVHFRGRADLLIAVLEESLPEMLEPVHALRDAAGQDTPHRNLERAMLGILAFHHKVLPMVAGLFAEPELLASYRKSLGKKGKGPHRAIGNLAGYIEAEQRLGRIAPAADASTAATLIMSAAFFRTFTERFFGRASEDSPEDFVRRVVASLLAPA